MSTSSIPVESFQLIYTVQHPCNVVNSDRAIETLGGRQRLIDVFTHSTTSQLTYNKTLIVIDDPLQHDDYFNVRSMVTLEDLFKNRAHFGHVTRMRNPWMSQYIYGHQLDVDIIDLDKTLPMLHSVLDFLAHIAYRQGIILFLTRYPAHVPLVERATRDCGEYAHCRKWDYPFTNTQTLFGYDIRLLDVYIFTHTLAPPNQLHPAISDSNMLLLRFKLLI